MPPLHAEASLSLCFLSLIGARAKAWCLHKHAEATTALSPSQIQDARNIIHHIVNLVCSLHGIL